MAVRTKLNDLKLRRVHVSDMPAAEAFLWWSDYAREQRAKLVWSERHTDEYADAERELEYANARRRPYVEARWLSSRLRAAQADQSRILQAAE